MAVTVSLREVVDELESLTEESTLYLDRETGELYALGDEEARLVEDGAAAADLPDWLHDELPRIREVLTGERWLSLPTRFDIHEWAIMDEFAQASETSCSRPSTAVGPSGPSRTPCTGTGFRRAGAATAPRRSPTSPWRGSTNTTSPTLATGMQPRRGRRRTSASTWRGKALRYAGTAARAGYARRVSPDSVRLTSTAHSRTLARTS